MGDPYPDQLNETADYIARGAEVANYAVGWQSAGNTPILGLVQMYKI